MTKPKSRITWFVRVFLVISLFILITLLGQLFPPRAWEVWRDIVNGRVEKREKRFGFTVSSNVLDTEFTQEVVRLGLEEDPIFIRVSNFSSNGCFLPSGSWLHSDIAGIERQLVGFSDDDKTTIIQEVRRIAKAGQIRYTSQLSELHYQMLLTSIDSSTSVSQ